APRLGHAHPPVALRGRPQRLPRARRAVPAEQGRAVVHRRAPRARPGDQRDHQPARQLLQAPVDRGGGTELRVLGAQQPVRPRARADVQAEQGSVLARRVPCARLGREPLPRLRCAPRGGSQGRDRGLRAARRRRGRRLGAHERRAPGPRDRPPADLARPGRDDHGGLRARRRDARRADLRLLPAQQASGVGGVPRAGDTVRAAAVPAGPVTSRFAPSTARRLIRAGFGDVARTERLLADPALRSVLPDLAEPDDDVLAAFAVAADPDLALLTLARLAGAVEPASSELLARVWGDVEARARLLGVTGASAALGNALVARPADLEILADDAPGTGVVAVAVREELLVAVGADPRAGEPVATAEDATSRMRRAYRARLLRIAASDLAAGDPGQVMPAVGAALADLAGAALEAALAIARAEVGGAGAARLAVIGMGKTGGRELNYVSDVDVVYVVEPGRGVS